MKNRAFLLLPLFLCSYTAVASEPCEELPKTMLEQLRMINYCDQDSDCVKIDAACPPCGALINKENVAADHSISNLQTGYNISNGLTMLKECAAKTHVRCKCYIFKLPLSCLKNKCVDSRGMNP